MPQGTIKKVITEKGYGFIRGEEGDVFFHMSSVEGSNFESLVEGQTVEYESEHGDKGPKATVVKPV